MKTTTKRETYPELRARHQKEFDDFEGIFFAFSNEQFKEGMHKVGLQPEEVKKVYSIPGGGFVRRDRADALENLFDRQYDELKEFEADKENLIQALRFELWNHEFDVTGDPTPALEALGLNEDEIDPETLRAAYRKTRKQLTEEEE